MLRYHVRIHADREPDQIDVFAKDPSDAIAKAVRLLWPGREPSADWSISCHPLEDEVKKD